MRPIDYRRKQLGPQRWLTRTEFVIVLAGVTVLTAILIAAGYYYFITLKVGF